MDILTRIDSSKIGFSAKFVEYVKNIPNRTYKLVSDESCHNIWFSLGCWVLVLSLIRPVFFRLCWLKANI